MASVTTTAITATTGLLSATIAPQSEEWNGDEFSNNLFSDLAPLLTLFGEQVTKQFLTMSMGWADNVLVSMGPLGILTVIVSAIRVGGVRKLKALIGRARESQATAEQELLSSTSDNVCELWSGEETIRQIGKPGTKELVLVNSKENGIQLVDLQHAVMKGWLQEENMPSRTMNTGRGGSAPWSELVSVSSSRASYFRDLKDLTEQNPNIALNIDSSTASRKELWTWAIFGVVLQSLALVVPGLATYLWKFPKASEPVQSYAYPCFLIGTCIVNLGLLLCSHVIEGVTLERTFCPTPEGEDKILHIFRLQKACSVGDQSFQGFAIFNQPGNKTIRTSRLQYAKGDEEAHYSNIRMDRLDAESDGSIQPETQQQAEFLDEDREESGQYSRLAAFSSAFAIVGFVCQFVGLRGLHWSATILQLGITVVMTGVRSWVRRGLAADPISVKLPSNRESIHMVLLFEALMDAGKPLDHLIKTRLARKILLEQRWELRTGTYQMLEADYASSTESVDSNHEPTPGNNSNAPAASEKEETENPASQTNPVKTFMNIQLLVEDRNYIYGHSICVSRAIEKTFKLMDDLRANGQIRLKWMSKWDKVTWAHSVVSHYPWTHKSKTSVIELECEHSGHDTIPKAPKEIFAVLSLWIDALKQRDARYFSLNDEELDMHEDHNYVRILGDIEEFGNDLKGLLHWLPGLLVTPAGWPNGPNLMGLPEHVRKGFKGRPVAESPVFGLSVMMETNTEWCDPGKDLLNNSNNIINWQAPRVPWRSERDLCNPTYLISLSSLPIESQCALEIYSGFINSIASQVEHIDGHMSATTDEFANTNLGSSEIWVNSVMLSLAQVLVDSGLVPNIEEANIVVIPPFARRRLLPGQEEDGSSSSTDHNSGRDGASVQNAALTGIENDEDEDDEVPDLVST
ncbi:hypothetical protein BU24DRAFT_495443 [Aaosphaeria arxii CBS 175.79]|uniref:Uncharacterized protein n=1 Tax=Aaosphaeria arxii CBS 175.79 TaxID=1450172 RepID=A0A6A5XDX8_9PLEO|nr:uncharacterized protein BU24DRAFT_495443 [Aaosphaeria arxii CBS 175.79]KAF2011218.1 hypothetical protein BU24DRAFT_495443 [Aaosphaeria arxii CBS 175.79]